MLTILEQAKKFTPWQLKILAKILLSRLPVGARVWQKLRLFSPGDMLLPEYALSVFETHYEISARPAPGFSFLELGPGDSIASALVGYAYGASSCWLVDVQALASDDIRDYHSILRALKMKFPHRDFSPVEEARNVPTLLRNVNATYLYAGLASLRAVPSNSCDCLFTQGVLEHLALEDFDAIIEELYRILKPGASSSHEIDFRDHLGASLHNLRFSRRLWEARWFAQRSGFYTNRLRFSEMMRKFQQAGFIAEVAGISRWEAMPVARKALHADFAGVPDEDLLIWESRVRLSKPAAL